MRSRVAPRRPDRPEPDETREQPAPIDSGIFPRVVKVAEPVQVDSSRIIAAADTTSEASRRVTIARCGRFCRSQAVRGPRD